MYVVYPDQLFIENLIIDYILMLVTAKLTGLTARRWRMGLSAALGGAYAVLTLVTGWGFLRSWAFKIAVGVLMVMVVFGAAERLLRLVLVFFGVSAAFAGAVMGCAFLNGEDARALYRGDVSFGALMLAFGVFYVLFSAAFRALAKHRLLGEIGDLKITFNNREIRVAALTDTGNGLHDPMSGLPVAVCSLKALEPLFEPRVLRVLRSAPDAPSALEELYDMGIYSFLLVPYRAVGAEGMLLAFRPQGLRRCGRELAALVAIDRTGLDAAAGYSAVV